VQNGQTHLAIGRLQIGYQTPFKARNKPLLEVLDLAGRAIAGEDDLLVAFVQGIERVKEFFLNALLACEKLNIVD
jgi:hypothetical protein